MAKTQHEKTIAAVKRQRTRRLATLVTKSYYLHKRGQDEKMYNLICEEFLSLGGVYIKFLQGVLLRSQVMRKWHNPEKLRIFENLDAEPINIATLLKNELPRQQLSQIATVQPQPFAAGSFGQVYYGQLRNGQAIVIKVLRPMVRELLAYDLKLLNTFSRTFFAKLYKNMSVELSSALKDFSRATLKETDYRQEAAFATELLHNYRDNPDILIPRTYLELSTDNIIVQDYVDGISLAQVVRLHEQGVNPRDYVRETIGSDIIVQMQKLGYESIVGIFTMPRIQGDPHPGNIRLLANNKVGLIDFGISAAAPTDKESLLSLLDTYDKMFKGSQSVIGLFEQGLRFFVGDLYHALKKLGDFIGKKQNRDYLNEVTQVAGDVFMQVTGSDIVQADFKNDDGILNVITSIVNKGNRFGLVMKLEATEILRAIQTFTSLLSSLGLYKEVMVPVLDRAVTDIKNLYPELTKETARKVGMGEAIETISNWLERVAERDPMLFKQLTDKISRSDGTVLNVEGVKNA